MELRRQLFNFLIILFVSVTASGHCLGQRIFGGGFFRNRGQYRQPQPAKVLSYTKTHSQCRGVHADSLCHKQLGEHIEAVLKKYEQKKETVFDRSPWGVMHAVLAWGKDAKIWSGNKSHSAIDLLCENHRLKSVRAFRLEKHQDLIPAEGPGLQGHPGQLLAVLAQTDIPADYKIVVNGKDFSVGDLIEYEQKDCKEGQELTFKLIGLLHYLPLDAEWENESGEKWSLTKLVETELHQPINGASCGGSHRLMALAMAAKRIKDVPKENKDTWKRADKFVKEYQEYTLHLFNQDGSFSTDWFATRQTRHDPQLAIQTTGHVVEWLVTTLPEDELQEAKLRKSIYFLCRLMLNNPDKTWSIGPRAHAIRALRIYKRRVLDRKQEKLAEKKTELKENPPAEEKKAKPVSDSTSPSKVEKIAAGQSKASKT